MKFPSGRAGRQREVALAHGVGTELVLEDPQGLLVAGEDEHAAGIPVEAVHHAGPVHPTGGGERAVEGLQVAREVNDLGAVGRVGQPARGLDHDQEVGLLVQDRDLRSGLGPLARDLQHGALRDLAVGPEDLAAVQADLPAAHELLELGLGEVPVELVEDAVEALSGEGGGDLDAVVFGGHGVARGGAGARTGGYPMDGVGADRGAGLARGAPGSTSNEQERARAHGRARSLDRAGVVLGQSLRRKSTRSVSSSSRPYSCTVRQRYTMVASASGVFGLRSFGGV